MAARKWMAAAVIGVLFQWVVAPSSGWAWGDGGHMAVAVRAWNEMTPGQRSAALALLRQHPRFDSDFTAKMPPGLSAEDQDLWTFAYAATWPDYVWKIREASPRDFQKYFHASWHVIGQRLALDPATQSEMRPLTKPATTRELNRLTVREALPLEIAELEDRNRSAPERAVALCWVMHMTGDLHEPCHTASLISKRFKGPDGDHVATLLPIEAPGSYSKTMHSLWDSVYCNSTKLADLKAWDASIAGDPALRREALPELSADTTVDAWVGEGFEVAKKSVYDADVRAAIAAQEADPQAAFEPVRLSPEYLRNAASIGRRRGALAGYRLADILRKIGW